MSDITVAGVLAQDSYASGTKVGSFALTASRPVPAGRTCLIMGAVEGASPSPSVFSGSDAKGNSYAALGTPPLGGTTRQVFVMLGNIAAALANADSITTSSKDGSAAELKRGRWAVIDAELTGLVAAPLDLYKTGNGSGSAMALSTGASVPAQASRIDVAIYSIGPNTTVNTPTGWTFGGSEDTLDETDATNAHKVVWFYRIGDAGDTPAAFTVTVNQSSNAAWAGILLTLNAAATQVILPVSFTGTGQTRVGGSTNVGVLTDGDDATLMQSPDNPSPATATLTWAAPSPVPAAGQTATFTLRLSSSGATSASATVRLYRSGSGTALQTWSGIPLTGTPTDIPFTLDGTAYAAWLAHTGDTMRIEIDETAAA
jgi:hypothetical protein